MTLQEAKRMIPNILKAVEPERSKIISNFQKFIWNYDSAENENELSDILWCLAYDLDYYEPNPEWRREDYSLYGEEKLIENIQEALQAIEALEIKNQNLQNEKD